MRLRLKDRTVVQLYIKVRWGSKDRVSMLACERTCTREHAKCLRWHHDWFYFNLQHEVYTLLMNNMNIQHRLIDLYCDRSWWILSETFQWLKLSTPMAHFERKNTDSFESKFNKFICITWGVLLLLSLPKDKNNTASPYGLLILVTSRSRQLCISNECMLS